MTTQQSIDGLNESLSRLETALLTPVVSGELQSWATAAAQAAAELDRRLPQFLKTVLHRQVAEIAKSDAELLSRVEQLVATDENLLLEQAALSRKLSDFAKRAAGIKKDEKKVDPERERLEQEGIALLLRIKKQRAAADTWLAEALYRDRGPVD